jgi:16S rRNA (cytidine1402-2'-O)-methyltransferase
MLYIVSTPIGNLGDITYRAIEILKSVDLIACEDTRHTKILCDRYGITTPLTSYYSYNKVTKGEYLIRALKEGKRVALVSDAGTPGISDPGFSLIRSALGAKIDVVSVPGATAMISALSISGFPTDSFYFQGFLPVKSGARRKKLTELKELGVTVVIYESPHRLVRALKDMEAVLGDRPMAIAREMTKKFEEVWQGSVKALLERAQASKPRGEFVIIF